MSEHRCEDRERTEPDIAPVPAPVRPPGRPRTWSTRGILGAIACLLAAAAAVGGSLLALFSLEFRFLERTVAQLLITGWELRSEVAPNQSRFDEPYGTVVDNGYPLVAGGVVLFAAALLGLLASHRVASAAVKSVAVLTAAVGAAFLTGTLATVGAQGAGYLDSVHLPAAPQAVEAFSAVASFSTGFWVELAGVVLAVAAAILAAPPRPRRARI